MLRGHLNCFLFVCVQTVLRTVPYSILMYSSNCLFTHCTADCSLQHSGVQQQLFVYTLYCGLFLTAYCCTAVTVCVHTVLRTVPYSIVVYSSNCLCTHCTADCSLQHTAVQQ